MTGGGTAITPVPGVDSYAPDIVVTVENQVLPLDDVIELRVTLQKDELGGFSMLLANPALLPDEARRAGSPGRLFRHSDDDRLDLCKAVTVEMGYAAHGRRTTMFVGEITALQPSFPSSGLPTLSVTGTDLLGRLRRFKPGSGDSKAYAQVADWQIAERIAQRHNLQLTADSTREGPVHTQVMQRDMDDLQFLLWLAKRNDFEAAIVTINRRPQLYFGRPRDKRGPERVTQYEFTWGQTLTSFTPRMRIGRQVAKVTVRGWDPRRKEKIEETATVADLPSGKGTTGAEIVQAKMGAKEERIVDWPVQSREEAKRLAVEFLTETANQFLTGSGEVMGEPGLRPQSIVKLGGLGRAYDGEYYISKCEHTISGAGYTTTFDVERARSGKP